jgi:hypothetical protein
MRRVAATPADLARLTGADVKTVYRWLSPGRPPLAKHRALVARRLGEDEEYLWPDTARTGSVNATAEVVNAFAHRSDAPNSLWWSLITRAEQRVDLLGYTLYFLTLQHPELISALITKCDRGLRVRAAIADPDSAHVAYRDTEERTPLTLGVRIRTTLEAWTPILDHPHFELRYQDVPLYNSVFRFDDEMLVTPHLYATPGSHAPMLHLRRLGSAGLFDRFAGHVEAIWSTSRPSRPSRPTGQEPA